MFSGRVGRDRYVGQSTCPALPDGVVVVNGILDRTAVILDLIVRWYSLLSRSRSAEYGVQCVEYAVRSFHCVVKTMPEIWDLISLYSFVGVPLSIGVT